MVSRKKRKAARENVQKARHVQAALKNNDNDFEQPSAGDDEDFQPTIKQLRKFKNHESMCFIMIGVLSSFLSQHTICGACRQRTLDIDVTQYNKLNTNVVTHSEASLMAEKYCEIKTGQLESFGNRISSWTKCKKVMRTKNWKPYLLTKQPS